MDSYQDFPSEFEPGLAPEVAACPDVAAAIGTDERRMHVRAYNYWVSLLEGRDFPSIEDLEPADVSDFETHSVLLDFTCGRDNPALPYVGTAIRDECAMDDDVRTISDVPSRSLLSRLTDHYMQIIANRAPVGFEAEFDNPRGDSICYRGILMPFSSDGDTIDFIYGVINWKHVGAEATPQELAPEPAGTLEPTAPGPVSVPEEWAEEPEPVAAFEEPTAEFAPQSPWAKADIDEESVAFERPAGFEAPTVDATAPTVWEAASFDESADDDVPAIELDDDTGLADRLWAARETAEAVKAGEGRTRTALYRALSLAYDFAVAARENLADYAELLDESGLKAQERAPMTPIVKLVFGINYDKARLTEFAAALSYAMRQALPAGAFQDLIEAQAGGLKALVAAERQARRPASATDDKAKAAKARLRSAPAITLAQLPAQDEFALVVTRRGADGQHELVAIVEDEALVERAIRRAA